MDQSVALNALAPYIALAKSATSPRAAADLITQATSAQNTYIFAELLQQPNIQALKGNADFGVFYELLGVFAWGTWETYNATPNLPSLSDAQTLKLRLLSLLTIASSTSAQPQTGSPNSNHLSYATLSTRLGLTSPIDLEHLITQAIYSNLLTGTLNPSSQTVCITSVSPLRDLAPGSIGTMIAELDAWSLRCTSVSAELDAEIAKVKEEAARRAAREAKTEKQVKAVTEGTGDGKGGPLGSKSGGHNTRGKARKDEDDDDEMDVDGAESVGKKGGGGFGGFGGLMGKFGRSGGR